MMWDRVLRRLAATLKDDAVLGALYGDSMRMATFTGLAFSPTVPTLEWTLIGDTESEIWAPCIVQFDQWAPSMASIQISERRLRTLFHVALPQEFGGLIMWCEYQDGTVLASPNRDGFAGRAIRFRFTPLRELYAGLPATD